MKDETLYMKIDRNIRISGTPVSLKDVATVLCREKTVENRAKTIKLPTSEIRGPGRYVFSVTDVIEAVQQELPGLEVCNLGESDFILTMEKTKKTSEAWSWCKTVLVSFLSFFGSALQIFLASFTGSLREKRQMALLYWKLRTRWESGSEF